LLLGAAEPLGDPTRLWRAAAELGLETDAAAPAEAAELIALGTRVLARSFGRRSTEQLASRRFPSPQKRRMERSRVKSTSAGQQL
jgi:hypothetical protein